MSVIETSRSDSQALLNEIRELRHFNGAPGEFWPRLLDSLGRYAWCRQLILLSKDPEKREWRRLGAWPKAALNLRRDSPEMVSATEVAERSLEDPVVIEAERRDDGVVLGFYLDLGDDQPPVAMVFLYDSAPHDDLEAFAEKLQLILDIPVFYQFARLLKQARSDVVQFADAIDLMTLLNECDRFMSAAMTFCNELASRHECDRVSLGWLEGAYVRVKAISHMEKFEKKMVAVQSLEAAMEEAFDQDEEIVWPADDEDSSAIRRDHARYGEEQGPGHLVTLPIHIDGEAVAVVTLERKRADFGEEEVRGLRLVVDQASRHLAQLKRYDRWFGARFKDWLKEKLEGFLGVRHTFAKALGIVATLALAILLFGWMEYRVEASFILRTNNTAFVPAPFDGYVRSVAVEVGDRVKKGETLLDLDTRELGLEEAKTIADISRYNRQMEKARAESKLADMRIAQALVEQSRAELARVRYHLDNAELSAPFDGIVVEGDLKEKLGAPVRKGDVLFRVADIGDMYVELDLPERDIHEVSVGDTGEIAFVSRPEESFPIRIVEIDPAAVTKEEGNVFVLKGEITGDVQSWWRPGMSGVAKVNVGDRNILWILTHRTVDFFRLLLWW